MRSNFLKIFLIPFLIIIGCKQAKEVQKEEKTAPPNAIIKEPAFKFKIAAIELPLKTTKYSLKSIEELANKLKNENVDIFTIKSVTRYPELRDRIDLLDELKKKSDMRYKFFEIENNSGRQFGNAIFSIYPFVSNDDNPLKSINFGSSIDIGITNLYVLVTYSHSNLRNITNKLSHEHQIIVGNFSKDKNQIPVDENYYIYSDSFLLKNNDELKVLDSYSSQLQLGKITICEIGIYKNLRK